MSGYHSTELCYLSSIYTNLLITKQQTFTLNLRAFKNNLLRVQPDILPPGSVRIGACSINEEPYTDFDAGSDGQTAGYERTSESQSSNYP